MQGDDVDRGFGMQKEKEGLRNVGQEELKWRGHKCKFEAMPVAFLCVLEEGLVDEKARKRTGVFDILPSVGVMFTRQL